MTLTDINGTIRFKVAGQNAQPKWIQETLKRALEGEEAPPEALRFQCRIASDARDNLKLIELDNGETLKLHHKSHPQFGKNHKGHPFLTATMTYSGDGENYTIKWVGDAVPEKMQRVAVKHDKGLKVGATTVVLDLSEASITPAWKAHGRRSKRIKNPDVQQAARDRYAQKLKQGNYVPRKRTCARMTADDLNKTEK